VHVLFLADRTWPPISQGVFANALWLKRPLLDLIFIKHAKRRLPSIDLSFNLERSIAMNDMTAAHKDKLMNDLRVVITDAEELLRATADQAGEGAKEVRGRIQSRLAAAKSELVRLQSLAVAKAKEVGHAADEYVHEHPWKSIGMAAGAALLVGLLIGRR
jgi:ElaB/YqjD/DUF883 family membrane-anchored ribosome-binding protein